MLRRGCKSFIRYAAFDIESMIAAILALEQAYDDAEVRNVEDHHTSQPLPDAYLSFPSAFIEKKQLE